MLTIPEGIALPGRKRKRESPGVKQPTPTRSPSRCPGPRRAREHQNRLLPWGLLPDNEIVLDHWAEKFHVSARNAFGLIACVGENCLALFLTLGCWEFAMRHPDSLHQQELFEPVQVPP
jgi:hypothetical protein